MCDEEEEFDLDNAFEFKVYSERWGHEDTYHIWLTDTGWYVSHIAIDGSCKPSGSPKLIENLKQDSIEYPSDLGTRMSEIWHKAEREEIDRQQIQARLEDIASDIRRMNGGV